MSPATACPSPAVHPAPRSPLGGVGLPAADTVLPGVLLLVGLPLLWPTPQQGTALPLILHAGFCALLLGRRRVPGTTFAAIWGLALVQWYSGITVPGEFALFSALYHLIVRGSWWQGAAGLLLTVSGVGAAARWLPDTTLWGRTAIVLSLTGLAFVTVVLALIMRARRERIQALERETSLLRFQRDQQIQLVIAAERNRIAREMHDIVGHSLGVMVSLSEGAAFTAGVDPGQAAAAMRKAADTGREAIVDVRRVLGVLREDADGAPGAKSVADLVERAREAGLVIHFDQQGDMEELSASLRLCVLRIVQESLTNTRRHAGPRVEASVGIEISDAFVEVAITDTGAGGARPPALSSAQRGGAGLIGLRERVMIHGGELEAGPAPGSGWRIRARIPRPDADGGATRH
ncbi:sensor histidine kinase [Nocardiopsis sp. CNT-189]|uniref:sensor histidine kinase n=1 Tax=Nocardiopsis oceanisediminis TaxID=2816862 RepID=UPI003B32E8F1